MQIKLTPKMMKKILASMTPEMKAKIRRKVWNQIVLAKVMKNKKTIKVFSTILFPLQFPILLLTAYRVKKITIRQSNLMIEQLEQLKRQMELIKKEAGKELLSFINPERKKSKKEKKRKESPSII